MGWLITLGILTALAWLPLGVDVKYGETGPMALLVLGPARLTLYPWKKKPEEKKTEKPEKAREKRAEKKKEEPAAPAAGEEKKGGSLADFLPLVQVGLELLNGFRQKLRVDILELKLTLGGDDPCDLAVNYGKAWAALGNLWPRLERFLVIKKRDAEVQCDFTASETKIYTRLKLTITLGRLLALGAVYGVKGLREFLKLRKKRKGGAVT